MAAVSQQRGWEEGRYGAGQVGREWGSGQGKAHNNILSPLPALNPWPSSTHLPLWYCWPRSECRLTPGQGNKCFLILRRPAQDTVSATLAHLHGRYGKLSRIGLPQGVQQISNGSGSSGTGSHSSPELSETNDEGAALHFHALPFFL